ncbi:formate dehydrogenase accessory sulfurtransferase FdhD [Sphingomonas sp. HF-S4]|uniref:Formate dehydrogenase accessory sulfurtransferase FdhD n=1 Tax=Sphingomonas agrestis TaxID=3080540 RepID=A0ABU3Y656_9SPHN|nr:formate dehydrogenase accessory sulfurtransferase FdhD [Sphingomonas sp. HF-S4]MDV3456875.1 formate dehydrogenase accessory sulfurtransferase FdhD [Sphingomonas sp. HF-S4]
MTVQPRAIAEEVPVAIECNGLGYAVLMASLGDPLDLGYGFALTERLIDTPDDVLDAEAHALEHGMLLRLTLAARVADRVADRVRHRTADSSCGLCGVESLEQALRPLPVRTTRWAGDDTAVFAALEALETAQPLGAATRAVHAAAACTPEGAIRLVREDVGRHNAFDKLIGAMLRAGLRWDDGFALLTSRCSYELVEKAARSDCPMLATISAPTALALDRARAAGIELRVLARPDALLRPL